MVRVRIAPSPTGYGHIGLARTALFNYLFAKKERGSFVLRIEDTDKERSKKEYEDLILSNLKWLGIQWDEGPDIGGPYGPYRQSERGHIYRKYLEHLSDQKRIYKCFCTKEQLDEEKQEQVLAKLPPRYSGRCKKRSCEEVAELEKQGVEFTLRFCLEPQTIVIDDLIRGTVSFDTSLMDDFIIAKDFDTPLYNFAVVIDDALMNITHVIRGEEHISNTPKQIQLARALELSIPEFGHLPLILDSDRKKMSKRENKTALEEYKQDGYLPNALINFIALLGWNPGGDRELFELHELENIFTLEQVNTSGSIFDIQKLDWFNGYYIRHADLSELTKFALPYFIAAGYIEKHNEHYTSVSSGAMLSTAQLENIVAIERGRIHKLSEISFHSSYYFVNELQYQTELLQWKDASDSELIQNLLSVQDVLMRLGDADWTIQSLEDAIKEEIQNSGKKNGPVLWPLRVALSGLQASPSPFEIASTIGKKLTLQRIQNAVYKLKNK